MDDGTKLTAKSVVLTTGTFLDAKCYIGQQEVIKAGRFMRHTDRTQSNEMKVEPSSTALAKSIKKLKFPVDRLRTGTPPRISKASIDYTGLKHREPEDESYPIVVICDRRTKMKRAHVVPANAWKVRFLGRWI